MTALLTRPDGAIDTWAVGGPRLLAGLVEHRRLDARTHLQVHGPMRGMVAGDREKLIAQVERVRLTGRGGAGFPLGAKLRALRAGERPVVVVNGSESEPASHKDRVLLTRTPHLVLDGALAVAAALDARRVVLTIEDDAAARSVGEALNERTDAGRVEIERTPDRFVAGEARAVVSRIGGGRSVPSGRRILPTQKGVRGAPTLLSNVETFAQVAVLLRMGAADFAQTGSHAEPGTTLLTVCGAVQRPGVVEIPIGTPLSVVLTAAGAAPSGAVLVGGYHGAWVPADGSLPLSRAALTAAGGTFGAGVVAVLGEATCALGEVARIAEWLAGQSAGQCGPCRFGLPALADDLGAAWRGNPDALQVAHRHANAVVGRGACSHPDGAARFVTTGLRAAAADVESHLTHGGCGRPVLGVLPL